MLDMIARHRKVKLEAKFIFFSNKLRNCIQETWSRSYIRWYLYPIMISRSPQQHNINKSTHNRITRAFYDIFSLVFLWYCAGQMLFKLNIIKHWLVVESHSTILIDCTNQSSILLSLVIKGSLIWTGQHQQKKWSQ